MVVTLREDVSVAASSASCVSPLAVCFSFMIAWERRDSCTVLELLVREVGTVLQFVVL